MRSCRFAGGAAVGSGGWKPNGSAPSSSKACAVCGKDLGPGPFAEGEPYTCSLTCFYLLHPSSERRRCRVCDFELGAERESCPFCGGRS
jgi:hypothetical protein